MPRAQDHLQHGLVSNQQRPDPPLRLCHRPKWRGVRAGAAVVAGRADEDHAGSAVAAVCGAAGRLGGGRQCQQRQQVVIIMRRTGATAAGSAALPQAALTAPGALVRPLVYPVEMKSKSGRHS